VAVAAEGPGRGPQGAGGLSGWLVRRAASPRFQAAAARIPFLRGMARREGAALFDIVQGFVRSQALMALVSLRVPRRLLDGPADVTELAARCGAPPERMAVLLQAGAAMGLLRRRRDGRFALTVRGAALMGAPGLEEMILHHAVLYRDLADPTAFLRGETDPELARFWPYVFGAGAAKNPESAERYSRLMTETQGLVAADALRLVDLSGVTRLMDVGGGTGAFVEAVAAARPGLALTLLDLPPVAEAAARRLAAAGLSDRVDIIGGSFRDAPLPRGADAVSLVRVLYDHADETVRALLTRVFEALPPGGRVIVAEPMSGGDRPDPITDVYFAFYCMAMRTGRVRSGAEIADLLRAAGFERPVVRRGDRPYVTSAVVAARPV
jgi:demethylspheroidene O-methyltransferase